MKIDIITIFPNMFKSVFGESIIKRAVKNNFVHIQIHNLRKWSVDKHKTVDDKPFGGGPGMILKIEPIYKALKEIDPDWKARRILFSASGARIVQEKVRELSNCKSLILICGRYEGVDYRVEKNLVDETISIGDFVLSGGEIPAMALTDAVIRLIPGVLGNLNSLNEESFNTFSSNVQYLEYPQFTRPAVFKTEEGDELSVPDVLLRGNHKEIQKWRQSNLLQKKN